MREGNGNCLWATICEVEPGLFRAIYSNSGSAWDEEKFPAYQTGSNKADAKRRFESDVRALGYSVITWVEVNAVDLALPHSRNLEVAPHRHNPG